MSSRTLNWVITITALLALIRLWESGGGIWWAVLVLMLLNAFIGAVANKAVEIDAKGFVVRFWRRLQLLVNSICFTVSLAAILYTLR